MANPGTELIEALRTTANRLRNGAYYAWGNHGACNCGNLVQSVTSLTREEILNYAQSGLGEWTELAEEYCRDTNAPVNLLIKKLEMIGLTPTDIHNIEYLRDKEVLHALPGGFRWLKRNVCEDVIVYFETFANVLEEKPLNKNRNTVRTVITSQKAARQGFTDRKRINTWCIKPLFTQVIKAKRICPG